jgi:hypothetical protein
VLNQAKQRACPGTGAGSFAWKPWLAFLIKYRYNETYSFGGIGNADVEPFQNHNPSQMAGVLGLFPGGALLAGIDP